MNKKCYLGIDTSNYTTSAAICDEDGKIVENIKILLDVKSGERGLRQSEAVFAHIKNIPTVMEKVGEILKEYDIEAVGNSLYPRDADGSYMPCFLSGEAAASSAAAAAGAPKYVFSHQCGHIMAAVYSSGNLDLLSAPFAAFHVSGGTTDLVIAEYKNGSFDIKQIGGTKDLNAGMAIDRAGVMMGLKFPCGRELERLALMSKSDADFHKTKISVNGLFCNLSGLENQAEKIYRETEDKSLVANFVFDFVARTLLRMTENLYKEYPDIPVLYAGGVMSNKIIKSKLAGKFDAYFAEPEFSSDNAAGIALLTRLKHINYK